MTTDAPTHDDLRTKVATHDAEIRAIKGSLAEIRGELAGAREESKRDSTEIKSMLSAQQAGGVQERQSRLGNMALWAGSAVVVALAAIGGATAGGKSYVDTKLEHVKEVGDLKAVHAQKVLDLEKAAATKDHLSYERLIAANADDIRDLRTRMEQAESAQLLAVERMKWADSAIWSRIDKHDERWRDIFQKVEGRMFPYPTPGDRGPDTISTFKGQP